MSPTFHKAELVGNSEPIRERRDPPPITGSMKENAYPHPDYHWTPAYSSLQEWEPGFDFAGKICLMFICPLQLFNFKVFLWLDYFPQFITDTTNFIL